jgi:hypothetical protein
MDRCVRDGWTWPALQRIWLGSWSDYDENLPGDYAIKIYVLLDCLTA